MQIGDKVSNLTMISEPIRVEIGKKRKEIRWKADFKCDCGKVKNIKVYSVENGIVKTCGCLQKVEAIKNLQIQVKYINKENKHYLYEQWKHIVTHYKKEVCEEWLSYINFYNWGINNHCQKGFRLLRKDSCIQYTPNNCYFISKRDAMLGNKLNTIESQNKRQQTCLKRYGVTHTSKLKENRAKAADTCIENYGMFPVCRKHSKPEQNVRDWLLSLGYHFPSTYKLIPPKEIDLYNQELAIGIEFCGEYWHTNKSRHPRNSVYHYKKYKGCLDQGVRLFTIYSGEWERRQFQWKNLIKSAIGVYDKRVFARKCEIKEVEWRTGKQFFEDYHIQGGKRKALVYFGVFHQDELLGVVSLNRHHRNVKGVIVLDRLCFKDGVQVVGGASKLLSHCIKWSKGNNYQQMMSWSDNRYSQGNVYEKIGFRMDKELPPDYQYVDLSTYNNYTISKQSMKTKEKDKELMKNYGKIYDCGKKRYVLDIQ